MQQVLEETPVHYKRPVERPFTKAEQQNTTILFGGLTHTHDYLLEGALRGLGFNAKFLPTPDNNAFSVGKEYCNRGQCNPTYYTVGNLIKYLRDLQKQGMEDVENKFAFLTAGSCGPCRFGMYEYEYRKALHEAGFPGFRVILFEQNDDFNQSSESGIAFPPAFFITLLKTIMAGDMINELGYKIRPYEVNAGETDKCIAESREILYSTLQNKASIPRSLRRINKLFSAIQVDYSRIKPKVKITGEFWAMTTEGDGNYNLHRWLESEGAEVIADPISNWAEYVFWEHTQSAKDRLGIKKGSASSIIQLGIAKFLFKLYYNSYRSKLSSRPERLPSQQKIADYAKGYYNSRISGGESHMEVGKHIMYFREKKAHLVLSVKPFGCMPSTQSDGVQAKVITDLKDSLFVSIETSGDGEVNVRSRVQMKLYEAKERARKEVADVLNKHGLKLKQVEEYCKKQPLSGMTKIPHYTASSAGNFIEMKAREIKKLGANPN